MNKIMTVPFYGTEIYGFQMGSMVVVAMKPIVEGIGLSWGSQYNRLKKDTILSEGIFMMKMPFGPGGPQEYVCLRLDLLHGWLFTIEISRVREDLRERILLYKRECYDVLHRHFSADRAKLVREGNENISLKLQKVREARHIWGLRAAAQLWVKEGLPEVSAMSEAVWQYDLFHNHKRIAA